MKLEDCTKAELVMIINRLTTQGDYHLKKILNDMKYERQKKKLKEMENWGQIADEARTQYFEFLRKYEGCKITDIPLEELKRAEELLKTAEQADEKYLSYEF